MPDHQPLSVPAAFLATLWGKILAVLAAITMVIGIYLEVIAAWRGTNEAVISSINVETARAQATKAKAEAAVAEAVAAGEKAKADAASFRMNPNAFGEALKSSPSPVPGAPQGADNGSDCVLVDGHRFCPKPGK
jgi:hypothetical protein